MTFLRLGATYINPNQITQIVDEPDSANTVHVDLTEVESVEKETYGGGEAFTQAQRVELKGGDADAFRAWLHGCEIVDVASPSSR